MGRYLSTREAAEYLGMSVDRLDRLCSNRDIAYIKPSERRRAFDRHDLDAFMRSRRVEPAR